jgi:hypothetical protein
VAEAEVYVLVAELFAVITQTPGPTAATTPETGSTVQIELGDEVVKLTTPFPVFVITGVRDAPLR